MIGLALGGGAARGFAHIGILRLCRPWHRSQCRGRHLDRRGGRWRLSAGHLDTLEEWARGLQPRNILGYLDIRLNGSGLIGGDKLAARLEAALGHIPSKTFR